MEEIFKHIISINAANDRPPSQWYYYKVYHPTNQMHGILCTLIIKRLVFQNKISLQLLINLAKVALK